MIQNAQKTPEVVRAQIAAAAAENEQNYRDGQDVLNSIGGLVLGQVGGIMPSATSTELDETRGTGTLITKKAGGGDETVADYTRVLRSTEDSQQDVIEERAELLRNYGGFANDIRQLRDELSQSKNPESHPTFLAAGVSSRAYVLHHNNQEFVAIMPRFSDTTALTIDHRVAAAARAKGVPHLGQVAAVSYEEGVCISERMPGTVLKDLSHQDIAAIKDSQLYDLVETVMTCKERGIYIDFVADAGNFLYNRETGFGIIDLGATDSQYDVSRSLKKMAEALSKLGIAQVVSEDKSYWADSVKQIVDRFTNISEARLSTMVK